MVRSFLAVNAPVAHDSFYPRVAPDGRFRCLDVAGSDREKPARIAKFFSVQQLSAAGRFRRFRG